MRHLWQSFCKRITPEYRRRVRAVGRARLGLQPEATTLARVRELQRSSSSTGCGQDDYWQLYSTILHLRPKWVLECGPGISTVMIARALLENARRGYPGRVVSIEENELYHGQLHGLLSAEELSVTDLVLSPVVHKEHLGRTGYSYQLRPDHPYDLVFIDGPVVPRGPECFDSDYLEVVLRSEHPVIGLIDGRLFTRLALADLLPGSGGWDMRHRLPMMSASQRDVRPGISI